MTGGSCGEVVRSILRSHCDGHGLGDYVEVFLDFDNAIPTDSERHLYDLSENVLVLASQVLSDVSQYGTGATTDVRAALQNPCDEEAQQRALEAVSSFVARVKVYYDLSLRIEQLVPQLLWDLCSGPLPPEEQLEARQALVRQLARLVDFVLEFDSAKMCTPALQNDFSFYRRLVGRNEQDSSCVELANSISLFLAAPTPMLSSLASASLAFVNAHPSLPLSNTTDTLATIVSVCRFMVERSSTSTDADTSASTTSPASTSSTPAPAQCLDSNTKLFCVRVMVGCVILFDHIDTQGAFVRDSPINVKGVVQVIRVHTSPPQTDLLLNALRYTTKTFSCDSTPRSVRHLLG